MTRPLNILAFAALCLVTAFVWDVAWCSLYDRFAPGVPALRELSASISFVIAPVIVLAALSLVLGQWRDKSRPEAASLFVVLSCMAAPFLAIVPAFAFMCAVFGSCFGD